MPRFTLETIKKGVFAPLIQRLRWSNSGSNCFCETFQLEPLKSTVKLYRYLYTHQIRTHRVTIDGQILPNQCLYCNRKYSKPETLEKHVEEVHMKVGPHEKKHLCDTCGKGFAQHSKLTMHKRVHTGYKPYSCKYCDKCFTKKDYLVMHERVHSGEKPYSCEYCGKCFSQGAPLRIHQRIHTGEKPYECSLCLLRFSSRGALNMHKNCSSTSG